MLNRPIISKRNRALGAVVAILVLIISTTATDSAASQLLDRIVAVVNEDIILLSELNKEMTVYSQRIRQQGFDSEKERRTLFEVRKEMLNRLVDEKLTDQEIRRHHIKIENKEIDNTIERIKEANAFTDEELRGYLAQEQIPMDQYREKIRKQIMRTRLVNTQIKSKIVITDAEIQTYYDNHPEMYGGKRHYHLKNILIRVPEYATDDKKKAAWEQIEALRSRIVDGEDFSDLAEIYSQGPTAGEGGDIGEFEESTLSPQILSALDGLVQGQTTSVLETDYGMQIFYVEAINRSEGIPLESVREELHEKMFAKVVDDKFISWLEDLRDRSHVKIIN